MLFGRDSTAVIKRQAILIKFAVINLFLITLTMIPAWITAMRIEKKIQVYFSSIFYSLEKPSVSIAELEKVIVSYNKIKFIENKQDDNKNSFAYLTQNEEIEKQKALKIALLGGEPPSKIEISKVSALDTQFRIAISTTPKTILDNILPKYFNLFYSFTIKNPLNPLSMVIPKSIFIIFLTLLSGLLTLLWASVQSSVFYKKEVKDKAQELEKYQRIKTAHLNFMENALNNMVL